MGIGELTNVTTGKARLSYVHLFKPYAYQQGQEEKFGVTVLVPKTDTDTMARINTAIEAAKQKGISEKWNGVCPPIVPTPVYDGDGVRPSDGMPFGEECKGHWVFTASAKPDYPPEVVDAHGNPIINQSEVYSGMYGRVNVNFFPYAFGGKKGIGCGLGPVQKLEDGETLSGSHVSAAQAFGTPQGASAATQNLFAQQGAQAAYTGAAPNPFAQPAAQPIYTGAAPNGYAQPGATVPWDMGAARPNINPVTGQPM